MRQPNIEPVVQAHMDEAGNCYFCRRPFGDEDTECSNCKTCLSCNMLALRCGCNKQPRQMNQSWPPVYLS